MKAPTVIVLGGGVAGMTAAHELAERGFSVRVYELREVPGGKARSIPVKGSGTGGNKDLPGEHGFRFFPGFYRHLPDTMKRIPYKRQPFGVFDNLVPTTRASFERVGQRPIVMPDTFPRSVCDVVEDLCLAPGIRTGLSAAEVAYFMNRVVVLLSSCEERRINDWENLDWWDFSGAAARSSAYRSLLADGITRRTVAAKANEASTRTIGYIFIALMHSLTTPGGQMDRLLNGPTSDVWIWPWHRYLCDLGVDYQLGAAVCSINCSGRHITGVEVSQGGRKTTETADFYVAAVPVEIMRGMVTDELKQAEPRLGLIHQLQLNWMNGIQFYLAEDVPLVPGHVTYTDAPFALTSISQRQFWPDVDFSKLGNGTVGGILSVDISDWETDGICYGKPAKELTRDEIKEEVWAQLQAHLNQDGTVRLANANLRDWFLDPDILFDNPVPKGASGRVDTTNLEPLLVNTAGSWAWRPEAVTAVDNLFLASDYVRTNTDLATMEGANEAARRAVNGIIDRSGFGGTPCQIWSLPEPPGFGPLKALDNLRYQQGLTNVFA